MDSVFRKLIIVEADTSGLAKLQGDVAKAQAILDKFGTAEKVMGTPITKVTSTMDKFGKITNKTMMDISTESGKSFKAVINGSEQAAKRMGDFEKALRRAAIVAPVWLLLRGAMMSVFNLIKDQGKFLVDMEDAMARIQIVGKGTAQELDGLKKSLVALSYTYGVSATEALTAAKIFAQQGRTVQETLQLTSISIIASKVLGDSLENTVNNLTAAVEGFNIPVTQATTIVDKWINVEKQFAVTSMDLANATKVAGASANQLGVSISEFLGDVTAIIEVTRKSGTEAGRALSFIYARLFTTAKTTLETVAKIPYYLDEQGKATFVVGEKTRKLADILGELASKWSTLDEQEKLNIATKLGSMRQMTVLNALMQNYNASLDARVASLTSAGQAEKAMLIVQETASYKSKQLAAAWNNLTAAIADTSSWKNMLDTLGETIKFFTYLANFEAGYRMTLAQQNQGILATIASRKSEISSYVELLEVRKKIASLPPSPENTSRLNILDTTIKSTQSVFPTLKITEDAKKEVQKITDELAKTEIRITVNKMFDPKVRALENEKYDYPQRGVDKQAKDKDIDNQIVEIKKQQLEELKKQYNLYDAEIIKKQASLALDEQKLETSTALTDAQKEQLELEYQLAINAMLYKDSKEEQIRQHIKLLENLKYEEDANKNLYQIEKLRGDLKIAEAESAQQISKVEKEKLDIDLLMQYEKASQFEKKDIIKKMELTQMTPEQQKAYFVPGAKNIESSWSKNGTNYDWQENRKLLQDMYPNLREEVKRAIQQSIINENPELSLGNRFKEQSKAYEQVPLIQPGQKPAESFKNISIYPNIKGADNINITVEAMGASKEAMSTEIAKQVQDNLLTDEDFQKLFSKKINQYI